MEILQLEINRLNSLIESSHEETQALKSEFEGYKLRAQSVLRTQKSQSKEIGFNGQSITEIEAESNQLRLYSTQLQEKLDISRFTIKLNLEF